MPSELTDELKQMADEITNPHVAELEQALQRAHRDIDRLKRLQSELRAAMVDAVKDNLHLCKFGSVMTVPKTKKGAKEEVAVAFCSDWQIGKETPSYNVGVCEQRIRYLADRIARITEIHRKGYPVRNLHVWLLGDMTEGELIFPGQAHRIEASLYRQVLVHGPRILSNFLRSMLTVFEHVHVAGVIGNHGKIAGRQSREVHPENNADLFLYHHVEALFQHAGEKRITFQFPPVLEEKAERAWYLVDRIGEYSCFLFHGDQIKAYRRFPYYGFDEKIKGWKVMSQNPASRIEPFREAACGHYHTDTKLTLRGNIKARVNGTLESHETHVAEHLATEATPSQHFMFVEPRRGRVTAEYEIDLSMA